MKREVIFDIETQKLFNEIETNNPADLGVSIVSLYTRVIDSTGKELSGSLHSHWIHDLSGLWPQLQQADRLIGFNSKSFDVPALQPSAPFDLSAIPHLDMFELIRMSIGRRLGLNAIAQHTLGTTKTDVGTNAVYYWNKGDEESLAKLRSYCEADVMVTKELYDYGKNQKQLKYTDRNNNLATIFVDFSYPPDKPLETQISLF